MFGVRLALFTVLVGSVSCTGSDPEESSGATSTTSQTTTSAETASTDTGEDTEFESSTGVDEQECSPSIYVGLQGISFGTGCDAAVMALHPVARYEHRWQASEQCVATEAALRCVLERGEVSAQLRDGLVHLQFDATEPTELQGLGLFGTATVPEAQSWLSHGFQSWSQSGMIRLATPPTDQELAAALDVHGDEETRRRGAELSWWYTYAGGPDLALVAGATAADRWKSWLQVHRGRRDQLRVRLHNGGAGERVFVAAGQQVSGEPWFLAVGSDTHAMLGSYAERLETRRSRTAVPPDAGWNSWYELWARVSQDDILANAALVPDILGPHVPDEAPPLRIVIDDGWEESWGDWRPNDKFPDGLAPLAQELKDQGVEPGVWIAPLLVSEDNALVDEHPEWFIRDRAFFNLANGNQRILDVTTPAAAEHLTATMRGLSEAGFDFIKVDFLFAGTYEGMRTEDVTGMEAYHRALQIIRGAVGEQAVLLGVGCPHIATISYVDGWRVGGDIAFEFPGPAWSFVTNQARSIAARWPICQRTLCDGDPPLLRDLPRNEVEAGSWIAAFAGGAFFLSDDLPALARHRRGWGLDTNRVAVGLAGVSSVPQDLFPPEPPRTLVSHAEDAISGANTHVVPSSWTTPTGQTVLLNTSDEPMDIDGVVVAPRASVLLD